MKERKKRVAVLVKETIAEIIQNEIRDPRLGFLTVTGVEMSTDLKKARVFFSVLGPEKERERSEEVLQKARGFIRHQLARKISLKYIPEIEFEIDQLVLQERRVEEILKRLKEE
ncbi:MAG: 30S ribosome-binding factor RbfA [candidate division WOR-3 bacterium]